MLKDVDLSQDISPEDYADRLPKGQIQMAQLAWQAYQQKRPVIFVFEGWDAAGKGGSIRRLLEAVDPRGYKVHPIAAPKGDEAEHHYLWRFWKRIPSRGEIAVFDRSWYGRVLVERVEKFTSEETWRRAYSEINRFEQQLVDFGAVLVKFWLHISPEIQLERFKAREGTRYKSWKLTDEDWRNREKWDDYERAVDEMLLKTSTNTAPWVIVEADSKKFARVKILETSINMLTKAFG